MKTFLVRTFIIIAFLVSQYVWIDMVFFREKTPFTLTRPPVATTNEDLESEAEIKGDELRALESLADQERVSPEVKKLVKELKVSQEKKQFQSKAKSAQRPTKSTSEEGKTKYILFWNEAYGDKNYGVCCGSQPFEVCEYKNCYMTNDRSYLNKSVDEFDLIHFHQRSTSKHDLPKKRSPHQIYTHWMMESASYPFGFHSSEYNGFFNWTFTYRRDSDFQRSYGVIEQYKQLPSDLLNPDEASINASSLMNFIKQYGKDHRHLIEGRNKSVAWFVSHCGATSRRDDYVKELKKHIDVDIYGGCGDKTCPRNKEKECWQMVEREYMFYLSFENSLCKDYITEKFYSAMNRSIVPITLGGALEGACNDYVDAAGAPPHSFIDALRDYPDPAKLATYLKTLRTKPSLFAEYFWWKDFYRTEWSELGRRYT